MRKKKNNRMRRSTLFSLPFILMFSFEICGQGFLPSSGFSDLAKMQYANGIAVADYDNDGDLDVYIVSKDAYKSNDPSSWNRLYENTGQNFIDVTTVSGLIKDQFDYNDFSDNGTKMGASWGDYDNDGFPDLFLTNQGKDQLWHNKGNGTFENVSEQAGIQGPDDRYSTSALWWDYDNDGDLDLYVSSWLGDNGFYRNEGNSKFTDISIVTGLNNVGRTWTSIPLDVNKDGLLDLYIINDFNSNQLFINQANDKFINATLHYNLQDIGNGMGVDICDYGNDGNFDIYITNISQVKKNPFFINNGSTFDNLSTSLGVADGKWGWGTRFFDMDHDMDEDLYVVNQRFFETSFLESNRFFVLQNGKFQEKATDFGLDKDTDARTLEVFDYDDDGDLDILLGNWGDFPVLYNNNVSNKGNWVKIKLDGTESNRNAYGAVVKIKTPDGVYQHRLNHGVNFLGQSIKPIHFGLSNNQNIEELFIFWPSGRIEKITDLDVNKTYSFTEGNQNEAPDEIYGTVPDEVVIEEDELSKESIARKWNELLLESIRRDYARPTVHARNLFHMSVAMYDAWAVYDTEAKPFFLGNTLGNYTCSFNGVPRPDDIESARNEAISYASYRLLNHRFRNSPGAVVMLSAYDKLMKEGLRYDTSNVSVDYTSGSSAALGNYIAQQLIEFGLNDGSNEQNDYANMYYQPTNPPIELSIIEESLNIVDPNRWQPLAFSTFIDQSGNLIEESTPKFLGAEWGSVYPFALSHEDKLVFQRDGNTYPVYHEPGSPPQLSTTSQTVSSELYKWNFSLVSLWSSHLDPTDGVMWDISPKSIGNIDIGLLPNLFADHINFYQELEGGDISKGRDINPRTGNGYETQMVPRGDYTRVLAEFWADGPNSETPPGHWFTILNYVSDHPLFSRKFNGKGDELDPLEWDVKAYFILSGAMHDSAITAWGIKGWYDYIRPISAIRYMSELGQSTYENLSNFHIAGIPIIEGFIEIVQEGDLLSGNDNENVGKIKVYAWKGHDFISNAETDVAGVGWILAKNWWPYQRPSFVTPPFAGYVSGHSTFSRAAAEVMTLITGDEFFPGGMGEFVAKKDEFLVFEKGPSVDVVLQWATYRDASDQTSLSRIWGGIHPPADDIPGRLIGEQIGMDAYNFAIPYFKSEEVTDLTKEISVYPNPTIENHVFVNNSVIFDNFTLFDPFGRSIPILKKNFDKSTSITKLEFSKSLSTGIYILVINNNSKLIFIQ